MSIRHISPVLRIGQRTAIDREIQLVESGHGSDPLDLTDAEGVTLTLEHYEFGYTAIQGGECTIATPSEGIVEYVFTQQDTSLHGRYLVQFEVTWANGETELVPPDSEDWVLDIGRRQPDIQPLSVPRIEADEGVFGTLQAGQTSLESLSGLGEPSGESVTDLYGQNLYYENGRLNAFDPSGTGEVFDHLHTGTAGEGGAIGASGNPAAPAHIQSVTLTDTVDETSAPETSTSKEYVDAGLGEKADAQGGTIGDVTPVESFRATEIDVSEFSTGHQYTAVFANGRAIIINSNGAVVYDTANYSDFGAVINQLNRDEPNGCNLHLTDLFNYSTDIDIINPIQLTGELSSTNMSSNHPTPAATGLLYNGSNVAFNIHSNSEPLPGVHLENFLVDCQNNGVEGVYIDGEPAADYRAITDLFIENLTVANSGGTGLTLNDNIYGGRIGPVYSYRAANRGIHMRDDPDNPQHMPSQLEFGHLHTRGSGDHGIYIEDLGESHISHMYSEGAGSSAIYCKRFVNSSVGMAYPENADIKGLCFSGSDVGAHHVHIDTVRTFSHGNNGVEFGLNGDVGPISVGHIYSESSGNHEVVVKNGSTVDINEIELAGSSPTTNLGGLDCDINALGYDAHRDLTPTSGSLTVSFDGSYSEKPELTVQPESSGAVPWGVSNWSTGTYGYDGVTLEFQDTGGAAINPTTSVFVTPAR